MERELLILTQIEQQENASAISRDTIATEVQSFELTEDEKRIIDERLKEYHKSPKNRRFVPKSSNTKSGRACSSSNS